MYQDRLRPDWLSTDTEDKDLGIMKDIIRASGACSP